MKRFCRCLSFLIACSLFVSASSAIADVKLPAIIGSNMVLQRDMDVPIWGTADAGEEVVVTFGEQKATATADAQGRWMVKLKPLKAGGPFEMTVAGENTITLTNILVGDAWVCAGQSNMWWPMDKAANAETEIAAAEYPRIRLFTVEQVVADEPRADTKGKWRECSPDTVADFSAVAYFFGCQLHKTLGVPIGLIDNSWGGSSAEAWTSRATLEADSEFKPILDRFAENVANYPKAFERYQKKLAKWKEAAAQAKAEGRRAPKSVHPPVGPGHWSTPSGLFNGKVMPLIPYCIKGVIWYQGERNRSRAYQYRKLFPIMIRDWRRAWGQGDFPFLFVQLANFKKRHPEPGPSVWAELREAQLMSLNVPNTAMAVTVDLDPTGNLHPKNKQDVGRRLALAAQATVYHQDVVYSGPIYDSMSIEGNRIRLRFKHVDGGLVAKNNDDGNDKLTGFTIAGTDRKMVWANARIEGDTVVLWSDQVSHPIAVRYAWADNPACNLYNKAGLPASPFRTDTWPGITLAVHTEP